MIKNKLKLTKPLGHKLTYTQTADIFEVELLLY
jgi:hypothetical protein